MKDIGMGTRRNLTTLLLVLLTALFLLAACDNENAGLDTPMGDAGAVAADAGDLAELAREDLADRLGIPVEDIELREISTIPETDTLSITFLVNEDVYQYHGRAGEVNLASQPLPPAADPPDAGGVVTEVELLLNRFREAGAAAERQTALPDSVTPLMVPAVIVTLNGEEVRLYEYPDAPAVQAEMARISPDGTEFAPIEAADVPAVSVDWEATPHFFQQGQLIALYLGDSDETLEVLRGVMGPQFAGG